jgi:transposase
LREHINAMQEQTRLESADPALRAPCRKVLTSLQEHWSGLTRFVDDPRIPLDNNACERQLRGPVLGRKNYYGSGAVWSGRLTAMLFSLFATLQRFGLNVRSWLTWYLQSCAEAGGQTPADVSPFLPWKMPDTQRQALAIPPAIAPPDSS